MTPVTETVVNGGPFASSNRAERRASPFRGSRSEAAEDAGSFEAAATARYSKMCETMISERMNSLIEKIGAMEARMEAQASASRQEIDGLKAENNRLKREIQEIRGVANLALQKIGNHVHRIPVHMKDSAGKLYVFNNGNIRGSRDGAIPIVQSLDQTGTKQVPYSNSSSHFHTVATYDCQPAGLHYESGKPEFR